MERVDVLVGLWPNVSSRLEPLLVASVADPLHACWWQFQPCFEFRWNLGKLLRPARPLFPLYISSRARRAICICEICIYTYISTRTCTETCILHVMCAGETCFESFYRIATFEGREYVWMFFFFLSFNYTKHNFLIDFTY